MAGTRKNRCRTVKRSHQAFHELFGEDGFESIIGAFGDAVSVQNTDLEIVYQNQVHRELSGDHTGRCCYRAYRQRETVCDGCPVVLSLHDGKVHVTELPVATDQGMIHLEVTASPVMNASGRIVAAVEVARDITYRKHIEEKLRIMSITDELTNLFNRRGFFILADQQLKLANRQKKGIILHSIDVDNLKSINDTFGHQEGDLVLVETANILKDSFRESDIIARIGGDEFLVLQGESTDDHSDTPVRRLQERLASHNSRTSKKYQLSMSLGTAYFDPESPCSIDELLIQADNRMYDQKKRKKL